MPGARGLSGGLPADPRFLAGVAAFGAGAWFAAHEAWEEVWREAAGGEKRLLAGLVQAAVGMLKLEQGRTVGGRRVLARARANLVGAGVATPVDVAALVRRIDAALAALAAGGPAPLPAPLDLLPAAGEHGAAEERDE